MYTFNIIIKNSNPTYENFVSDSYQLIAALERSNQIVPRKHLVSFKEDIITIPVVCPEKNSLAIENGSIYYLKTKKRIEKACGNQIKPILLGMEAESLNYKVPKKSSFYILRNGWDFPLFCGDTGAEIPLYKIPKTDHNGENYDNVYFWNKDYRRLSGLWLSSGAYEQFAEEQMQYPRSAINKRGRELCALIEKLTGVPTYYFLHNYRPWSAEKDKQQKCPITGNDWLIEGKTTADFIAFKCDESRLVSELSTNSSEEEAPLKRIVTSSSTELKKKNMTEIQQQLFTLNNGVKMPALGLGVLFAKNEREVENAVVSALQKGYRKIDTASAYQNEEGVGIGLKQSGIPRAEIFLTTKMWNSEQGYDQTLFAFEQSLKRLQTDYLDLYLIHWPVKHKYIDTYKAMEQLYKEGRVKAIGVCNFSRAQLTDLMEHTAIVPALNQVEMHPHLNQNELMVFAKKHNIQLEAWRPIMMGEVLQIPKLVEIGKSFGKSAVQISLRWLIQRGVSAIPKSTNPKRITENIDLFDFELTPNQMAIIEGLNQNRRLGEDLSSVE